MNKINNKRYKLTEMKIENALIKLLKAKDFDSVYINDICKEAGISRTSFYSHYDDINDLILKIQNKHYNNIIHVLLKKKLSSKDAFTRYFYYLRCHSDFYKAYLMSSDSNILIEHAYNSIFDLYPELIQKENKTERETKYHMVFIGAGIKAISRKWLLNGCIETPEEMIFKNIVVQISNKNNTTFKKLNS